MKKLFYTLILAVIITACGKDNPDVILGTWELQYFYRDIDGNSINFNNAETYEKINAVEPLHTLIFSDINECGLTEKYNATAYRIYDYEINNGNIIIKNLCEEDFAGSAPNHFLGYPIKYKFKDNFLIIGHSITIYSGHLSNIVIYGYYKRVL